MFSRRFMIERNIDHFHSRFRFEEDQDTRDVLLRLLIAEENKLGSRREKLEIIEKKIKQCSILIEKQTEIINQMKNNGQTVSLALQILTSLTDSQNILQSYKAALIRRGHISS